MRPIPRYRRAALVVHDHCASGATDPTYLARIATVRPRVAEVADDYRDKARATNLYQIHPRKLAPGAVAAGKATRKDLNDLYEQHMVGMAKPARVDYDQLLLAAKYGVCPYCGLGEATTLDHYLPKSRYPEFSVTPDNLVPACKDCQSKKGRSVAASGPAQTLHPYFDDEKFFHTQWVFGRLQHTSPLVVLFDAIPPTSWSATERARAIAHFKAHDLGRRFAVAASSELAAIQLAERGYRVIGNYDALRSDLSRWADAYSGISINDWKAVLYRTLSLNAWYCSPACG